MPALYMIDLAHKSDVCECCWGFYIFACETLMAYSRMKSSIITLMLLIYVMPRMKIT